MWAVFRELIFPSSKRPKPAPVRPRQQQQSLPDRHQAQLANLGQKVDALIKASDHEQVATALGLISAQLKVLRDMTRTPAEKEAVLVRLRHIAGTWQPERHGLNLVLAFHDS